MRRLEDGPMNTESRSGDDLLDVARALLLLQGAILVATTIEALVWGAFFPGGGAALLSGVSAVVILVARVRLRADRRWSRRLVYVVEGSTVAFFAVDIVLAAVLAQALPPVVALLTQLVLPISVVTLLRRSARAVAAPARSNTATALGGVS
jgi:hypothetical protein